MWKVYMPVAHTENSDLNDPFVIHNPHLEAALICVFYFAHNEFVEIGFLTYMVCLGFVNLQKIKESISITLSVQYSFKILHSSESSCSISVDHVPLGKCLKICVQGTGLSK